MGQTTDEELKRYSELCQRIATERNIDAHEVALEFATLEPDEHGKLREPIHHGKDSRFWFDVAEYIDPDMLNRGWTQEMEDAAQDFVRNSDT